MSAVRKVTDLKTLPKHITDRGRWGENEELLSGHP